MTKIQKNVKKFYLESKLFNFSITKVNFVYLLVKKVLQKKGVSKGPIIKYILLVKIKDTTKQLYKRYNYEEHQHHQEHCQEL